MADRSERFVEVGGWPVLTCAVLAIAGELAMGIDDVLTVVGR